MIAWDRPRMTQKVCNAPESGGCYYTCFASSVGGVCLDYKQAELKFMPAALKDLELNMNCRYTSFQRP